ncbi:MAG: DUF2157 domain-containing protein [Synergistaceae bacterium]|nr:DUF2157 domain-containing protein [Synergistaceae bacterium]
MERRISESRRKFLSEESRLWVEDGLISGEARAGIMARYVSRSTLPEIVPLLGIAMIGLGVLSFIAANWRSIPDLLKVIMIIGAYLGCAGGAYALETKGRRLAPDMLMFLSGFLLMGGLALISQTFHIGWSASRLLVHWLLTFAPTFLIVRSMPIYILYEAVSLFYINLAYIEYEDAWRYFETDAAVRIGPIAPIVLMLVLVGFAWRTCLNEHEAGGVESKLRSFFVGGPARRIFWSNFIILNWFTWMCAINSRHESILPFVAGVLVIGVLITLAAMFLNAFDLEWQGLLLIGAAGIALSFPFTWQDSLWRYSASAERALLPETLLSSVALGSYLVYRIIRRFRGAGFTTFLFCALLARWYFGMFFSFMSRALFFISGGVILLLIALASRRWNRLSAHSPGGDGHDDADA